MPTGDQSSWASSGTNATIENNFGPAVAGAVGAGNSLQSNLDAPQGASLEALVGYKAGTKQWHERVENYSPWNDVFSMQQQEAELVVDVPFENRYLFLIYCLGYNYVGADNKLHRINPIVHPYWNWMRCARVAHKGIRFEGKRIFTNGGGNAGVAQYKLARFSLGFANYPWRFYEDSQIDHPETGQEIYRNTYYEFAPTTQFLSAEGGANTLFFPYDSAGNPTANGSSFRASMGTPVNQLRFKLHWKWVPYDFVFKGFVPINLINAMGYLNQASFLNDPNMVQGTLRIDAPEIVTFVSPIRTGSTPELLCDITLNLVYFNPTPFFIAAEADRVSPSQVVPANAFAAVVRGHNLVPDRYTGLWKPSTRKNAAGVVEQPSLYNQMLQYTDLYKIFQKPV